MNKNRIRLTESQLHNVIRKSVRKVLKEGIADNSEYFAEQGYAIDRILSNVLRDNIGTSEETRKRILKLKKDVEDVFIHGDHTFETEPDYDYDEFDDFFTS